MQPNYNTFYQTNPREKKISYKKIFWCSIVFILIILFGYIIYKQISSKGEVIPFKNDTSSWDVLLFVQSWPISYCSEWKEQSVNNTCFLPQNNNSWTIHGIWPTKTGTTGPAYCPSSVNFNRTQLEPLIKELNTSWPSIQYGHDPYIFWKHEWKKHGECATNDSYFDSETKYFKQGLTWLNQYNMREILNEAGIFPGNNFNTSAYNFTSYWNAITEKIQKDPHINCFYDKTIKNHLISEIYICFDKQLNLVDCDNKNNIDGSDDNLSTNCPLKTPIVYPSIVPDKKNFTAADTS